MDEATLADAQGADPYLLTFLSSGYSGLVDKMVVSGVQGYYAMDDFTFHTDSGAVPEPTSVALTLLALGGLARASRRKG